MSSNGLHLFFLLFARLSGFFLISPLFSGKSISKTIRMGFAFACSLVLLPPLHHAQPEIWLTPSLPVLAMLVLKEIAIGYLVGFIFSLILEAAAFAGQVIGTLMGFSATELLDPLASSSHPLLSRFLSLFVFTLFLILDLHHPLIRLLYSSFETLPLNQYPFTQTVTFGVIESVHLLFSQALAFALFPLILLLSLIAVFALLSRFFPIFWIGFPLQLLVGLLAIGASIGLFTPILEQAFFQFWEVCTHSLKKFIVHY